MKKLAIISILLLWGDITIHKVQMFFAENRQIKTTSVISYIYAKNNIDTDRNLASATKSLIATYETSNPYYVDAIDGDDTSDGLSPQTAWKTLTKVNAKAYQPGDYLLLKAGSVWNGHLVLHGSGTDGKPIILDMYGAGNKPIINGGGGAGNRPTILLQNEDYWEINNLEITNTDGSSGYQSDLWGIRVNATVAGEFNHIYIRNCYIHAINGDVPTKTTGGIYVTVESPDGSPAWYNDLKIQYNRIGGQPGGDLVGGLGIATQSTHGATSLGANRKPFLNVLVSHNIVGPTGRNNIILRVSDNAIVEYNRLQKAGRFSKGHSIFNFNTHGFVCQFNEAYGNTGPSSESDRGGFDADYHAEDTYYQYNYSHDNNWGFAVMKRGENENVNFRYNISENDKLAIYFYGFESDVALTDAHFYNNTHYVKSGLNVQVFRDRTALNSEFVNNIFYFEERGTWGSRTPRNCTFENNCFYNISPRGSNYIAMDPQPVDPGTGGQNIDWSEYPDILTGYQLQSSSPCINAGKVIADNGGQDFWGNPLYTNAPDIGAYESPDSTTAVKDKDSSRPESFMLFSNHPNPFNPTTCIQYTLPELAFVRLEIYNSAGQNIRILASHRYQSAGEHDMFWDGLDQNGQKSASGVYMYRISATGTRSTFSAADKMLLLR